MRSLLCLFVIGLPGVALAGGFELPETSPAGVAMAGAQTAVATDASANFYNPAGMAFQPGLQVTLGGNLGMAFTDVKANGVTLADPSRIAFAPTIYVTQRLGRHFAIGVGGFSNFDEHFEYPTNWVGRYSGQFVDITTSTFNGNLAFRPIDRLSIGFGVDITPSWIGLRQAVNFGGADGQLQYKATAVGVGANAAVMLDLIPRYLRFGFNYRSRMDLGFSGPASLLAPPEVASMAPNPTRGSVNIILPHNMSMALAVQPTNYFLFTAELRITLWSDQRSLVLNLRDASGNIVTSQTIPLGLKNSYGGRFGAEYRVAGGRVPLRVGIGFDNTPLPRQNLGPLLPDTNRVLVGCGLGYRGSWWSIEASYLAQILLTSTSTNPQLGATYSTLGHVLSAALILHFERFGGRLAVSRQPSPSGDEQKQALYGPLRSGTW